MDIAASMSIYKKSDQTFPALWNCLLFHFSGQIFPRSNRKPAASGCLLAFGFVLLTLQKVQIFQKNCLLFLHSCEQVNSEKSLVVIHCVTSVRCCLLWSVLVTQNSDHDQKPKSLKQTYLDLRIDTVVNVSTDFGVASYLPKPLSNIKIKKQIFEFFSKPKRISGHFDDMQFSFIPSNPFAQSHNTYGSQTGLKLWPQVGLSASLPSRLPPTLQTHQLNLTKPASHNQIRVQSASRRTNMHPRKSL